MMKPTTYGALDLSTGGALRGPLFARLMKGPDLVPAMPPGYEIGPFRIVEILGRGGSADVYLAERADGQFEQRVALKLFRQDGWPNEYFVRERQLLAGLNHPGIARLYDGGVTEGGMLWFAMEPVFGERIDKFVRKHQLDWRARIELIDRVCEAVQYAHGQLIVHRDIKPANILIDERGFPRLLDFGVASSPVAGQSSEGCTAFTPGVASPEQRRGEPTTVASDIYQLGLLLDGLFGLGTETPEALPKPLPPRIAKDLMVIIRKACADLVSLRYHELHSLRRDLAALLTRRPISIRATDRRYRIARFVERHFITVVSTSVAALGAVAIVALAMHDLSMAAAAATREATRAQATSRFLSEMFTVPDPGKNRGAQLTANEILINGGQRLRTELTDQPLMRVSLAIEISKALTALGEYQLARGIVETEIQAAEAALPRDSLEVIGLLLVRTRIDYMLSEYAQADAEISDVQVRLAAAATAGQRHDLLRLDALTQRGLITGRMVGAAEAAEQFEKALSFARTMPEEVSATALLLNNLGLVYEAQERFGEAGKSYLEAIDLYTRAYGKQYLQTMGTTRNYARMLIRTGDLDSAERLLDTYMEGARAHKHPRMLSLAHEALAYLREAQGRWNECVDLALESADQFGEALGKSHHFVAFALRRAGLCEGKLGHHAEALALHLRDYELQVAAVGANNPESAQSLNHIGASRLAMGDPVGAERDLMASMEARARSGDPYRGVALALINARLAAARIDQGDSTDGRAFLANAERLRDTENPDAELERLIAEVQARLQKRD